MPASIDALVADMLAAFDERREGWCQALRQDAVESIGRMTWRRHVSGIRVPVYDMFVTPMRQGAEALGQRFVDQAARLVAVETGRPDAELVMTGRGALGVLPIEPTDSDLVISRALFEGNVTFRRRYESTLVEHAETLYSGRIRPWFDGQLALVLQAMRAPPL